MRELIGLMPRFSLPSHESTVMSYFFMTFASFQKVVFAGVAYAGPVLLPMNVLIFPMPLDAVNSTGSIPIFGRMHPSGSAEPVVSAIFGMSPSD